MEREQIKEVLRDVFGGRYPMRDLGGWVSLACPLAQWTHASGSDSNPSFGVSVNDSGTSVCNCFTCGNTKPFHAFLRQYSELSGVDIEQVIKEVEKDEFLGPTQVAGWDAIKNDNMAELLMPIDAGTYMDIYPPAHGHPYLRGRGISDRTVDLLELRFDPGDYSRDGEPRILFPVRGTDGLLYGFSGRATNRRAQLKVRDYYGLKKSSMVLGSHLAIASSHNYVLAVEGLFDYANAWECGYPGCAVMHSSMTEDQADIFKEIGKKVYDFFDNDAAGGKGMKAMAKQLSKYLTIMQTTYPEVWIAMDDHPEGGEWLSDPGQMEPEEFREMIEGATLYVDEKIRQGYSSSRTGHARRKT